MTANADLTEEHPTETGLLAEESTESGSIVTMASAKWGALLLDVATLTRQGGDGAQIAMRCFPDPLSAFSPSPMG